MFTDVWPPGGLLLHCTKIDFIKCTALAETSSAQIHRATDQTHRQQKGWHQLAERVNLINLRGPHKIAWTHMLNRDLNAGRDFLQNPCCKYFALLETHRPLLYKAWADIIMHVQANVFVCICVQTIIYTWRRHLCIQSCRPASPNTSWLTVIWGKEIMLIN